MGMKKSTFTYFSTKLYNYLKTEMAKVKSYIDTNASDIQNIDNKLTQSNENITKNTDDIKTVSDKVDNIQTKIDNGDFDKEEITNNINGNVLNLNNVKQYVFKDIQAGETIEIKNENARNDFLIQCFEQVEEGAPLTVKSIEVTPENKDLFEYDERYVEIDETGAHPKNHVEIQMDLQSVTEDGISIYVSHDTFPIELFESIDNITSYEVIQEETE